MLRIRFAAWEVVFTERGDGDLRVSSRGEGEPLEVVQQRVLALLGVDGVAVPRQVHGADVVVMEEPLAGYVVGVGQGDGVVTAVRGLAAGVHVADCLPIAVGGDGGVAGIAGAGHCCARADAGTSSDASSEAVRPYRRTRVMDAISGAQARRPRIKAP